MDGAGGDFRKCQKVLCQKIWDSLETNRPHERGPTALLMQYIKNVSDTLSYLLQFDIFFMQQVVLRKYRLLLHLLKWSTYGQPY